MKQILVLPLLHISSGHHRAADAVIDVIQRVTPDAVCDKMDLLRYGYGAGTRWVSDIYLKWITRSPDTYQWLYEKYACRDRERSFLLFRALFEPWMKRMLREKRPDAVFCTHALPSRLMGRLKRDGYYGGLTVNVYTDYFVNDVWGGAGIDRHLVSHPGMVDELMQRGVPGKAIRMTGIPVARSFMERTECSENQPYAGQFRTGLKRPIRALIAGGNLGVGNFLRRIQSHVPDGTVHYKILCGHNTGLYQLLRSRENRWLEPLSYIDGPEKMNRLYEEADVVITKPGGVTISECLHKELPMLIPDALPGQERKNLEFLTGNGLAVELGAGPIDRLVVDFVNGPEYRKVKQHMAEYHRIREDYRHVLKEFVCGR